MLALIDARAPLPLERWLEALGHTPLRMPPHPVLQAPVASHPDMLLFPAPDAIYCTRSYAEIANRELECIAAAAKRPIRYIDAEYGTQYPHDVLLNAACVGNTLFCLPQATAKEIVAHVAFFLATIKQGYAKCSVIPVGENALMTADTSIARAAEARGMDVLRLCTGHIALDGYDYGFPGGAASYAPYGGTDTILFCGDLSLYPSGEDMRCFCNAHGHRLADCKGLAPTDVGTLFLI